MKILAFDTCFNKTYIVLKDNEHNIVESEIIESNEQNYHSVYLIPKIRDILVKHSMQVKDIDVIGVNIGPGSFTGIRAGVTIARVLAQQFDIKLVGIDSLQILSNINSNKNHTTVVLDARKNKVYYGEYEQGRVITPPCLVEKNVLLQTINKQSTIITDNTIGQFLLENGINSINYEENDSELGIYLESIVRDKALKNAEEYNWAKVKPLYIQPPSITKPKEKNSVF